jgi:hypothetical protein
MEVSIRIGLMRAKRATCAARTLTQPGICHSRGPQINPSAAGSISIDSIRAEMEPASP